MREKIKERVCSIVFTFNRGFVHYFSKSRRIVEEFFIARRLVAREACGVKLPQNPPRFSRREGEPEEGECAAGTFDGKSESSHRSQFLVGFMANQRGRGASPSLIGPPHCFSTVKPLAGFMNVQRAPMTLRSVRSRRRTFAKSPRGALCSLFALSAVASCEGCNDDYDDDDDDDDQDEKNQN